MKNDAFTQLTLWSEEVLQELEVSSTGGEISEIDQDGENHHQSDLVQLTLPGFDETD